MCTSRYYLKFSIKVWFQEVAKNVEKSRPIQFLGLQLDGN